MSLVQWNVAEAASVIRRDLATVDAVDLSVVVLLRPAGFSYKEEKGLQSTLRESIGTTLEEHGISVAEDTDTKLYVLLHIDKKEAHSAVALGIDFDLTDRVVLLREIPGAQELRASVWKDSTIRLAEAATIEGAALASAHVLAKKLASKISQARDVYSTRE